MSKKGSIWDNPFGGLFDINRDGKEDWSELWLAQKMLEEDTKAKDDEIAPVFDDAKYGWRDTAEDGFEFGIDPEDYETEEEYEEALETARSEGKLMTTH